METIPVYIPALFILIVCITLFLLAKAVRFSRPVIAIMIVWLLLQAIVGSTGFYCNSGGVPPRFVWLILPPVIFILFFLFSAKGRRFSATVDAGTLTLLHVVRFPVEIVLYLLFLKNMLPEVMTFEGRNFDIFCGLTAPFTWYFGYRRKTLANTVLIIWNCVCLLLLGNIVVTAILSAPFRFQQFGFDHPNVALFYFPFVWLPCFVVQAALFSHLVLLRQLFARQENANPRGNF